MKIVVIGSMRPLNEHYTYATSFATTLHNLGHTVITINTLQPFNKHVLKKIYAYFLNYKIIAHIKKEQPNLIIIIKGNSIFARTLRWIKQNTTNTIVHFHPDNPFAFWNGNSNANVLKGLPYIDYWLSWSHMLVPALLSAGANNVIYFPFAFDHTQFSQTPTITSEDKILFSCSVSFVGSWEPAREQWLTHIITTLPNIDLKIWGYGWNQYLAEKSPLKKVIQTDSVTIITMIKIFQLSMINLNFIRQQNSTAHNMRTFEIPASNGFVLAERTNEHISDPFRENENIACFSSQDELVKKILFYTQEPELRKKITNAGNLAVQEYTLQKQLGILIDRLNP